MLHKILNHLLYFIRYILLSQTTDLYKVQKVCEKLYLL